MPEWRMEQGRWSSLGQQREAALRLLGSILGEHAVVEHGAGGEPFLPNRPDLYISISHCRAAVAVVVSRHGRVGIDVECRRSVSTALMERVCSKEELEAIGVAKDPVMEFLRCWTRKEAVLKMKSTGIKGFSSLLEASAAEGCTVVELECGSPDIVAALAVMV